MKRQIKINNKGYSLYEVLVVLVILGIMVALIIPGEIKGRNKFLEKEFERECELVYFEILQYQNDAMMDGCRRQLRFLDSKITCLWTKDKVNYQEVLTFDHLFFTGNFTTGNRGLSLYAIGTVSEAGVLSLNNKNGQQIKKITVQVGNGRIYLEE